MPVVRSGGSVDGEARSSTRSAPLLPSRGGGSIRDSPPRHEGHKEKDFRLTASARPHSSFPNSVWERMAAKLCLASAPRLETEFRERTFPNRIWERGKA